MTEQQALNRAARITEKMTRSREPRNVLALELLRLKREIVQQTIEQVEQEAQLLPPAA